MYQLSGGLVLGWSLGANDAANVFGTAVASRMIRYRTAVIVTAGCAMIGAVLQGGAGIKTLGALTTGTTINAAAVSVLIAGLTVILMTWLGLPVSTSQAVVGAIIGIGLYENGAFTLHHVDWRELGKILTCWFGTPIGAAVIAALLYPTLGRLFDRIPINLVTRSIWLKWGLLAAGAYGAYALGANNVANTTGMFYNTGLINGPNEKPLLALLGGASIAAGVLTYSRQVMFTVGNDLVQLGAFSALIAVLAEAITVHVYAIIGVPVSTSQAIVGAVLGIGIAKSIKTINKKILLRILAGWVATPAISGGLCFGLAWLGVR